MQHSVAKEQSTKNAPTPEEIRKRAFEIPSRTRSKENSMLKISFSETPTEERWILYGHLTVPWVHERKTCWKKNHRTDVGRACIVDLNQVRFIDALAHAGQRRSAIRCQRDLTMHDLDRVTAKSTRNGSAPKSQGEKAASPNVDAALALNTCIDAPPETKNLRLK